MCLATMIDFRGILNKRYVQKQRDLIREIQIGRGTRLTKGNKGSWILGDCKLGVDCKMCVLDFKVN